MKNILLFILIMVSYKTWSTVQGDINTNTYWTEGWIESGQENWDYYSGGFAINPYNNSEYYHAYVKRDKNDVNNTHIVVLEIKNSLTPIPLEIGVGFVKPSMAKQKIDLVINDNNGGVFMAYSFMLCQVGCEQNVAVEHYRSDGVIISTQYFSFDLGSTYLRQNDEFINMIYMPEVNRLAVAVAVDQTGIFDVDFGVAVLDVDQFGVMALSSNFSSDGRTSCYFDQYGSGGSLDIPRAITYENSPPYNIIVGGSVFEGNGVNNDGWNLGFCEFDQSGVEIRKWSTKPLSDFNDDREFLQGMKYSSVGGKSLIIAASIGGLGGLDFAITKYLWDVNNNVWNIDTSFGDNTIFAFRQGWNTKGFEEAFVGQTNDDAKQLFLESDGSILVAGESSWTDNANNKYSRIQLVKFNSSGQIDSSWGYSGSISHTLTNTISEEVMVLTETTDNKDIFLTGSHMVGNRSTAYIARLINTDVIFTSGFESF